MLTRRIIPCLDVRDGRVVKGVQFQNLRDMGDPAQLAKNYEEQGADEIVVLDVSATVDARETALATVRAVRAALGIPLTVGGGVRTLADVEKLLHAGADKVSINSAAVQEPQLLAAMAAQFGSQCTILAIDAIQNSGESWEVVTRSGTHRTGIDVVTWARQAMELGAGEVLLTSWDRDGTHQGYDLPLLQAVSSAVNIPVIASGGASGPQHLAQAFAAGASAALAASIFHDAHTTVAKIKNEIRKLGVHVRL
jgi:imidazoleglycerol phosphate synthase cyclase subunit